MKYDFNKGDYFIYEILYSTELPKNTIKDLIQNEDGTYSCDTSYEVQKDLVKNGKLVITFKDIAGDFECTWLGLTSLEGCPQTVAGDFACYKNKLTDLKVPFTNELV